MFVIEYNGQTVLLIRVDYLLAWLHLGKRPIWDQLVQVVWIRLWLQFGGTAIYTVIDNSK